MNKFALMPPIVPIVTRSLFGPSLREATADPRRVSSVIPSP